MRATWRFEGSSARLFIGLDEDDSVVGRGQEDQPVRLVTNEASFEVEGGLPVPHPDVQALLALVWLAPFLGSGLTLDQGVSQPFADTITRHFGIGCGPVDPHLTPRRRGNRIGVSFSAGVDSTATALLLPPGAPLIHLRRVRHRRLPHRNTRFRADVHESHARGFQTLGHEVHVGRTDAEFLVAAPHPTFPTWPAVASIACLMGDVLDLGGIAFGAVHGSCYIHEGRFRPMSPKSRWFASFAAAGLEIIRPIAGLTEVSTTRIVEWAGLGEATRSCPYGGPDRPCMSCMKCTRKELTDALVFERVPNPRLLSSLRRADHPVTRELLEGPPFPVHQLFEYLFLRLDLGDHPLARAADAIRHLPPHETEWLERHYAPTLGDNVPSPLRREVADAIGRHVDDMTDDDLTIVQGWDSASRVTQRSRSDVSRGTPEA